MHYSSQWCHLSELADQSEAIERLKRRLARERSARLQAEAIAERVTSDRWEVGRQLEEKLALRTSELEAARRTASEAITERNRSLSQLSHDLRTSLAALFFLAESLSEEEPPGKHGIEELKNLLSDMLTVLDAQASALTAAGADAGPAALAGTSSRPQATLTDIISAHSEGWQQVAARSGKLLILDIDTGSGELHAGTADEVNQLVLSQIRKLVDTSEPVIELHLRLGPGGLEVDEALG